jgi:hypothetical protein
VGVSELRLDLGGIAGVSCAEVVAVDLTFLGTGDEASPAKLVGQKKREGGRFLRRK